MKRTPVLCALLSCAALALGCRTLISTFRQIPIPGIHEPEGAITEEELHQVVMEETNSFNAGVSMAADAIAEASQDRRIRRNTLVWKIQMIPLAQEAASQPKATESLLALYTLATAQRNYLADGEGRDLFGAQQDVAVRAATEIESGIEAEIARFLPKDQADRLNEQVEQLSNDNPIRGVFMLGKIQSGFSQAQSVGAFDWFITAPLAPFRALQGVESGAAAIHEFNTTARQLGEIAAGLPVQIRWQLELFLYDLEDRETVISGLAAFEKIADSSQELSQTAANLPQETREQLQSLLTDSSQSQTQLRTTLDELRQTLTSLDGSITNARPLADSLERFATQADQAGKSWGELIATVRGSPANAGAPPSKPFDIAEYERTAVQLQTTATELRALVAEVQGNAGTSFLDALLWRALAFVAACFTLLLAYRALAGRVGARRT